MEKGDHLMRRLSKAERAAALAVAAAAVSVAGTGYKLIKKHSEYVIKKAAAFFKNDQEIRELDEAIREEEAEAK